MIARFVSFRGRDIVISPDFNPSRCSSIRRLTFAVRGDDKLEVFRWKYSISSLRALTMTRMEGLNFRAISTMLRAWKGSGTVR